MAARGRKNVDEALAVRLAAGATAEQAAAAGACSPRTVARRLADPRFRQRLQALRAELFHAAAGKLASIGGQAADVLTGLLASESETLRLRAAVAVLDAGIKLRELTDLEERITALETAAEDKNHATTRTG